MTAREAIERARVFRPNAAKDEVMLSWLSELEGRVHVEIFLLDVHDTAPIFDMDTELFAKYPHDAIYEAYLIMQTDLYHKEYDAFSASRMRFDELWGVFARYMATYHRPADDAKRMGRGADCDRVGHTLGTVQPFWSTKEAYIGVNGNWWYGGLDTGIRGKAEIPYVGSNGNWWVGNEDTGVQAGVIEQVRGGDGFASVILNDTENNETNVPYGTVAGGSNKQLLRGFRIADVDAERGGVWLHSARGLWPGDNVVFYKKTEGGVEKYRDRIVSIGAVCKECASRYAAEGKYLIPFASPYIGGDTDDIAWNKAAFVDTAPTITTWKGVPTTNANFKNASLKITHDEGAVYVLVTAAMNFRAPTSNIEVTIRVPNGADIKAAFHRYDFDPSNSSIASASINRIVADDYSNQVFEIAVPCELPSQDAADMLVNVGCYFSDGYGSELHFNWGGTQVEWGNVPHINETKAIKAVLLPACAHGEFVMLEDEIKRGIEEGDITLVTDADTHYASGAYIIVFKSNATWDDIGTEAFYNRQMLGDTELTFAEGDPVTGFSAGLHGLTGIGAVNLADMSDVLGTDAFGAGRYLIISAERGAGFGYMVLVDGHEGFGAGVKNKVRAYAGFGAGGESNEVNGRWGHGSGFDTKVTEKAEAGRAAGKGTIANAEAQDVSGTYNIVDETGELIEIVGNGTCDENYVEHRSNARTLDRKGNMWIAGELTFGPGKKTIEDIVRDVIAKMNKT